MDSSSSPPNNNNSLAFSLSNHFPNPSSSHSTSPLSLFHSFTSYPSLTLTGSLLSLSLSLLLNIFFSYFLSLQIKYFIVNIIILYLTGSNTVDAPPEAAAGGGATNLSIFTAAPKFEDFLGGSAAADTTATGAPPRLQQFSTDNNLYDSELKTTIAACFPRGFAAEPTAEPQKPSPKKTVDTFGQRTSIYRGVTRYLFHHHHLHFAVIISFLNNYFCLFIRFGLFLIFRHRWTGRYEAHLWDNSCRREGQSRKGRQGKNITC